MSAKIEYFALNVETPNLSFSSGDLVRGECYIQISSGVLKMKQLTFELFGQAECDWSETVRVVDQDGKFLGYETHYYHSKQLLAEQTYSPAEAHQTVLNPGKHQIGFRLQIPDGIPNSFMGTYGDIDYYIRARIRRKGLFAMDRVESENINVNTRDLFPIHELTPKVVKKNSKTIGLFGGKLTVVCEIPRTGFNTRSSIPVYCSIVNESKKSMTLRAVLKQKIQFIVRFSRKVEKEVLSEVFGHQIESRARHKEVLNVPVPVTAELLQNSCKIIKVNHLIEITLIIPGSWDLHLSLPVLLTDQQLPEISD